MSLEQKSSRRIIYVCAATAIGAVFYAALMHDGGLAGDGNGVPSQAKNEPESNAIPVLSEFKIIKAGEGAILCEPENQCTPASSGMEGQKQRLVSVNEESAVEYRLENKWHRHVVQGIVARTHSSHENPYLLPLLLEDGWIKGELKNITAIIRMGQRYCKVHGGNYSASFDPHSNASEFKLASGWGRCIGADGSVHQVSPEHNTVKWEGQ